jgi:hypothetical protein
MSSFAADNRHAFRYGKVANVEPFAARTAGHRRGQRGKTTSSLEVERPTRYHLRPVSNSQKRP